MDENGFDSQELAPVAVPTNDNAHKETLPPAKDKETQQDIWDAPRQPTPASPPAEAVWLNTSPLSSPIDIELPPVDLESQPPNENEISESYVKLSQEEKLGHDDERQVARQAAVRYERSLQHPYLLENAQYSTLLRQNGRQQDEDFEDDSQGSRLPDISEESQFLATSPMIDPSSAGETDTTSLPGEDLPALEDLMKQNIRSAPNRVTKRRSSPPRSTARKPATLRLGAHHLDSPAAARNSRRSPERDVAMIEDVEPPRMQSPHLTTSVPPRPLVIERPDDGGSASEGQAFRLKNPKDPHQRHKDRSPEREPRRATQRADADSDDDTPAPRERTTDEVFHNQTRLELWSDDGASVIEDNAIDHMLPGRKRQSNTPKRRKNTTKRQNMSITNMFDGSQATTSSAKESKSKSTKRQSKHSRRPAAPPRLSILDIAARAAKDRRDQGRSNHLDAVAGSIPQRSSVSAARKQKKAKLRPPKEPLGEASPNLPPTQRRQPPPSSATPRRLVRQVTHGGTPTQPTSARQQPRPNKQLSRTGSEMDETNQGRSFMFKAKKRRLDHLYRKQRSDFSNASSLAFNDSTTDAGHPASPPPEENPPLETEKPKSRYRKKTRPQQVDIEAPQFITPVPEPVQVEVEGERFRGLGPYGTRYTYHFETFPLNSRVYFHESTLIGSGILEFFGQRFRSAYNLGEQTLRWGPWDAQVSSELDQLDSEDCPPALSATAFVMKFMMDSLSLTEPTNAKSFVGRMLEVLRGIDGRSDIRIRPQCGLIASIYDHLLVVAFLVLSLCRNDDSLMGDQFQIEDLLKDMAKTAVSTRGLRGDILEHTRIPRSSFWDIAMNSLDAQQHEQLWKNMFILLPLTEFNDKGIIAAGSRHDATLMKKVFQLYQENPRQSPSFNNYCRALQWGWRKCVAVIGVIFDFFGSQNLAHLRNEEVFKSPNPSLAVEKGDRCFHIFLKLIALSIQKLKEVDSLKDIRNLEQTIHERELAALRNHHDLLCTLFWASPPDLRPGTHLIERLVEACLINLRSWSQLARFVIASGEATTSFKPFAQWRNGFFQSLMQQFDSFLALTKDGSNTVSSEMVDAMVKVNRAAVMDVIHFSITASLDVMRRATDLEAATFALNTLQLQQVFKHFTACPPDLDWSILQAALATLEIFLSHVDEFKENEESQQSESQILNSAQADDAILVLDHDLSANFFSMARAIISARSERNLSTTAAVDKFRCTEMVVTLSARLGVRFMNGGLMRLVDMFKFGKYGLFEDMPVKINLDQRKYLALFITTLLKQGYDDFNDAGFTLSEVWVLSIVKPRNYLAYENQFAQELQRHGKDIVPEAAAGLAINPDYSTNRDMFEFAASWMRKSMRDAGPALRKMMLSEYSKTLKAVMQQIKGDLRAVSQDATEHPSYVTFIRDIVALIRAHGPDICTVDDFFYQINKEYSPSVQDPQLQVAGMLSYGLRLSEGDTRVIHQLFFFLFNNFKMSMINNKLGDELKMLHRGMKNPGILAFILGKMLPAVIQASFIESSAFPLLEVYVEAMRVLLTRSVIPHELTEQDLQSVVVTVAAFVNGLEKLSQDMGTMTLQQVDVLINVLSLINTLWPSFRVLSICEPTSVAWDEVCDALKCARGSIKRAEELTRDLLVLEDYSLTGGILVAGVQRPGTDTVQADTYIKSFTDNIVNDVRRNWVFTENKISIQAPGKGRNTQSTQPVWNVKELVEDLHEHTKEWSAWYRRVFEASPLSTEYCVSVLF
ncbi:Mus7/MMS22 family-domain-containing protein [Thelonectria olida]|uniref:Mus7/MMS22 family-domain-containing protein n=1 Tax=Thelonectria olida TaxID=1576542 RepID=A0A9P9AKH1_9HYPO|nr:Mus7/MMS22 family-domain-containing protein [Thelonectria olida]